MTVLNRSHCILSSISRVHHFFSKQVNRSKNLRSPHLNAVSDNKYKDTSTVGSVSNTRMKSTLLVGLHSQALFNIQLSLLSRNFLLHHNFMIQTDKLARVVLKNAVWCSFKRVMMGPLAFLSLIPWQAWPTLHCWLSKQGEDI